MSLIGADLYTRMIQERKPFALMSATSDDTTRLREHPRWPASQRR